MLQHLNVLRVVRGPKQTTVFWVRPHQAQPLRWEGSQELAKQEEEMELELPSMYLCLEQPQLLFLLLHVL